eukprot:Clim_evm31s156 gene=Clim_evmTU31s156
MAMKTSPRNSRRQSRGQPIPIPSLGTDALRETAPVQPGETLLCVETFKSKEAHHVGVEKGEQVLVIERASDDWYEVETSSGKQGYVKANHFVQMSSRLLSSADGVIESLATRATKGSPRTGGIVEAFSTLDLENTQPADSQENLHLDEPLLHASISSEKLSVTSGIREGWMKYRLLSKSTSTGKVPGWRDTYAILRDNMMELYKDDKISKQLALIQEGSWEKVKASQMARPVISLNLNDFDVERGQIDQKHDAFVFVAHSENKGPMLALAAKTSKSKDGEGLDEWTTAMNGRVRSLSTPLPMFMLAPNPGIRGRFRAASVGRQTVESENKKKVKASLNEFIEKRPTQAEVSKIVDPSKHQELVSLESLIPQDTPAGWQIPPFLNQCIKWVELHGLTSVGVYRRSGSAAMVQDIMASVAAGKKITFSETETDMNVVCGCLKTLLRNLEEPLIPSYHYSAMIEGVEAKTDEDKLRMIREEIFKMPQCHIDTLQAVIGHLDKVASFHEENKMDPKNLSVIFGPNLTRPAGDRDAAPSVMAMVNQNNLCEFLIMHYEEIFL